MSITPRTDNTNISINGSSLELKTLVPIPVPKSGGPISSNIKIATRPKRDSSSKSITDTVNEAFGVNKKSEDTNGKIISDENKKAGDQSREDHIKTQESTPVNSTDKFSSNKIPNETLIKEEHEKVPEIKPEIKSEKIKRTVIRKVKKVVTTKQNGKPDYNKMNDNEKDIYRMNFKNKFELLRKWYPSMAIPVNIETHEDLNYVHDVYEVCIKFMYTEINSSFYRGILLLSWLGLEFLGTMVLGLDVSGYCQQQINLLWAYEPLINELSQVDLSGITAGWSPFQKLIGLILGTFAFMVIVRMVLSKMSDKFGANFNGFSNTVTEFVANMFAPKQQPVTVNVGNVQPGLQGIHNIPISSPPRTPENQIGMTQSAVKLMNLATGKSSSTAQTPSTSYPPPPSPSTSTPSTSSSPSASAPSPSTSRTGNGTATVTGQPNFPQPPKKREFKPPKYDS